jgi:hypothetical protein
MRYRPQSLHIDTLMTAIARTVLALVESLQGLIDLQQVRACGGANGLQSVIVFELHSPIGAVLRERLVRARQISADALQPVCKFLAPPHQQFPKPFLFA